LLELAYHGEDQKFEFWGKRANGDHFLKEVSLHPGIYFGQQAIVAMAQDITARKENEDKLNADLVYLTRRNQQLESELAQMNHLKSEVNNLQKALGQEIKYHN